MLGTTIAFLPRQPPFGSAANRQQQSTASNDRPQYRMLIDMICPVYTFLEFLELINYDMHTMLDYLITHETCFLLYFLRFLKYIRGNWTVFQNQCSKWHNSSSNSMRTNSHSEQQPYKRAMDVLITLRVKLERLVFRNQFPYNISPLVFLMHNCENLYEGNTFGLCWIDFNLNAKQRLANYEEKATQNKTNSSQFEKKKNQNEIENLKCWMPFF